MRVIERSGHASSMHVREASFAVSGMCPWCTCGVPTPAVQRHGVALPWSAHQQLSALQRGMPVNNPKHAVLCKQSKRLYVQGE